MPPDLIVSLAVEKKTSDDLTVAGDYCFVNLIERRQDQSDKIINAVILKCPYCGCDMATTQIHRINRGSWLRRWLSRFGFSSGLTIKPWIQCPYQPEHRFEIINGRYKKFLIKK